MALRCPLDCGKAISSRRAWRTQPDDRHFVLPRRDHGESIRAYIIRIDGAANDLRRHPRRPD